MWSCVCVPLASGILHRAASNIMSHLFTVVGSQWPYVRLLRLREHRANASLRNPLWYYFHRTSTHVDACARFCASGVYTGATFCHLNSSCVAHRIKRHARFFSLPSSQTEQEMRKLKINPIKNNYFLPRWMCSTCARADNTFNNPALLLICVEMVFKFSERSKWSKYKKSSRAIEEAYYKRRWVFTVEMMLVYVTIIAKCDVHFWISLFNPISQGKIISTLTVRGKLYVQHPKCRRKDTLETKMEHV